MNQFEQDVLSPRLLQRITEDEMKAISAPFINANRFAFTGVDYDHFRAMFGVSTTVATIVWNMIVEKLNSMPMNTYRLLRATFRPKHLLYGFIFLKIYPRERQISGISGVSIGRDTYRKWSQFAIRMISSLFDQVVRMMCIYNRYFVLLLLTPHGKHLSHSCFYLLDSLVQSSS